MSYQFFLVLSHQRVSLTRVVIELFLLEKLAMFQLVGDFVRLLVLKHSLKLWVILKNVLGSLNVTLEKNS